MDMCPWNRKLVSLRELLISRLGTGCEGVLLFTVKVRGTSLTFLSSGKSSIPVNLNSSQRTTHDLMV